MTVIDPAPPARRHGLVRILLGLLVLQGVGGIFGGGALIAVCCVAPPVQRDSGVWWGRRI